MNELSPSQILWPLLTILVSIAAIASVIIGAAKLRRIPPLPEELAKTYATKKELSEVRREFNDRVDREMKIIGECNAEQTRKLDSLISTTNHSAMETQRSLGRIEGKLDAHLEQHT